MECGAVMGTVPGCRLWDSTPVLSVVRTESEFYPTCAAELCAVNKRGSIVTDEPTVA